MSSSNWVDVLIPTCNRAHALAITLTSLAAQDFPRLRIVISDQSEAHSAFDSPEVATLLRYLGRQGRAVHAVRHLPRRGMAEQRAFLLSQAQAPCCLFLDDDVLLESDLVSRLHAALQREGCGFVGSALHGLSFVDDVRPDQQAISFWDGPVQPESVTPDSAPWQRHHLHSAANLLHVQERLGIDKQHSRLYRVAWVGGCVLFDTEKLRACGGFDFWNDLPETHCGEDVLAQLRVMARFGGCGLLPSGAYHLELPTTLPQREVDAPKVLPVAPRVTECWPQQLPGATTGAA